MIFGSVRKNGNSRLVVADAGNCDNTHIMLRISKKYPKLIILNDTVEKHGLKISALYKYAVKYGADYIFRQILMDRRIPER